MPTGVASTRKRNGGGGLLGMLRRMLQRKREPESTSSAAASSSLAADPTVDAAIDVHASGTGDASECDDDDDEWSDDDELEGDGKDGDERKHATSAVTNKSKSKRDAAKRSSKGKKRWVRQLLNPVEKKRDRVHKHHRRVFGASAVATRSGPPTLFAIASSLNAHLVAHILLFLDVQEPGAVCACVNTVFGAHVRAFYATHCPHPRPPRYLAQQLFACMPPAAVSTTNASVIRATILSFVSMSDRVRASACCRSLYESANALPLTIVGSEQATRFVKCMSPERLEARFSATTALHLESMDVRSAVTVVQLLDTGECECFPALAALRLCSIWGLAEAAAAALFVQFIQVLFTDRVSRNLRSLELIDLGLEDPHYRHLAQLLYDARFPVLTHLSLARNRFSSRFVRDWSKSFANYCFQRIEALDVSGAGMTSEDTERFVACLTHVPTLQRLCISNNIFSSRALALLSDQVRAGALQHLTELASSAITTDANAMGNFVEALSACRLLQSLDVSGNRVTTPRAIYQLSQAFATQRWPALRHVNLSNMAFEDSGFQALAEALCSAPASAITHLDVSGNAIKRALHSFSRCLLSKAFAKLQVLSLADNGLEALEFELIAHALASGSCPVLQTLDLSMNAARSEGVARFCAFLRSRSARSLYALSLSQNEIPHSGLVLIAETLQRSPSTCLQLQELDVSRNLDLRSVVKYQDMIRSHACPSLVALQFGYAQTFDEGRAFVDDVLARMSVEELRRRKQARFEQRLAAIQDRNFAKAQRDHARCKRQCQLLRERYDHLETEADRALRRRKKIRKSPHLMIHQEIQRLKQEQYHRELCRALASAS